MINSLSHLAFKFNMLITGNLLLQGIPWPQGQTFRGILTQGETWHAACE